VLFDLVFHPQPVEHRALALLLAGCDPFSALAHFLSGWLLSLLSYPSLGSDPVF
jgi:hypothetical protein